MKEIKLINSMLSKSEKKQGLSLIILMFFSSFSSVLMIASVMPFVLLVSDQSKIDTNFYLKFTYDFLGSPSKSTFLIVLAIVSLLIVVGSNLLNLFKVYCIAKYSHNIARRWSKELFSLHLNQDYGRFIELKPAVFIRNTVAEPQEVVTKFLIPLGLMLSSTLTLVIVISCLFFYSPYTTLSIITLFSFSFLLLSLMIKKKLILLGKNRIKETTERGGLIQESIRCFRDIKMMNSEAFFENKFNEKAKSVSSILIKSSTYSQIPRYWLQTIFFGFVLIGCIFFILMAESNKNIFFEYLPVITMFALAGQRLLPEVQTLYTSRNSMLFSLPALKSLDYTRTKLLREQKKVSSNKSLLFRKEIILKDLMFKYSNGNYVFGSPISFEIKKGDKIGLVGPSGVGKSTLLAIFMGLLRPSSGEIRVDDIIIDDDNIKSWMKNISEVPQDVSIIDNSLKGNITIGTELEREDGEDLWDILEMVELSEWAKSLPKKLDTNVMEGVASLSGGQRQRIGIARALYRNSDILVLDEATASLDKNTESNILEMIYDKFESKTIISITHREECLRFCDRVIKIDSSGISFDGAYGV